MYVKYLESEAKKVHILTSNLKLIQIKFLSKKEEKFCLNKSQSFFVTKKPIFYLGKSDCRWIAKCLRVGL